METGEQNTAFEAWFAFNISSDFSASSCAHFALSEMSEKHILRLCKKFLHVEPLLFMLLCWGFKMFAGRSELCSVKIMFGNVAKKLREFSICSLCKQYFVSNVKQLLLAKVVTCRDLARGLHKSWNCSMFSRSLKWESCKWEKFSIICKHLNCLERNRE